MKSKNKVRAGTCLCGCDRLIGDGNASPRVSGYINGHEPELDMTEYEEGADVTREG